MIFRPLFFILFLITQFNANASGLNSVARTMALSGSNVAMNSVYNSNDNIASLANSEFNGFGLSHQLNYFVKELSVSTFQFSHSLNKNSCVESILNYSGNKNFNELIFKLAMHVN